MTVDLKLLGDDGKRLFREWKEKVKKHNSYLVKNKYHKERKMDVWNQELNELNDHYRKVLKSMESERKKEESLDGKEDNEDTLKLIDVFDKPEDENVNELFKTNF